MPRGNKNADIDRRDMMKYLGAGGAAAVAGCGGGGDSGGQTTTTTTTTSQTQTGPVEGGRMTIGTISEARGLNPLKVGDGATSDRVYMLMDGGMGRKDEDTVAPFWFESWELADSLDVVNIKLREDLTFGEPGKYNYSSWGELTADDYLTNITEIFRSDWYPYTYEYNFFVDGEPIKYTKEGKYSIRAELPEPRPFYFFSSGVKFSLVVPEQIVQRYAPDKNADGLDQDPAVVNCAFNGNLGPWDLNKWNRQSIIVYDAANEWYMRDHADEEVWSQEPNVRNWENAPYFDQFAMQVFDSENTMRQALRAGQIHYASIPATKVETFQNDSNIQVTKNPFISYSDYTGMNHRANGWMGTSTDENPFRNKKVRHAIANCYNRNFVVENILDGEGATQGTLHPSWGPYYPDGTKTFDWTIDRARQLFNEGTSSDWGYTGSGNSGQFVGPDGEQVELKCVYVSGTLDDLRAEYLKSRVEQAGLKVNLETTGWAPLLINYFYTNNPAPGYSSGNLGYGENNSQHPSIFNWGPRERAISSRPWDLMLTLGFSYGPYDPAGVVDALYGRKSAFNAYGYEPSFPLSQWATEAVSADTQQAANQKIRDILLELSKDQPSAFESNYYGFNGYWKTVRGMPPSPRPSYFSDASYEQMWFSNGGT